MSEYPSYRASARYIEFVRSRQADQCGRPVALTPAEIARATGISETDQIQIRQTLMLSGRLRLSVDGDRWTYQIAEAA